MENDAVEVPALPPGYWTGQHRCEVRYFVQYGTYWVTDGVDVEAAGPREVEDIRDQGTVLADGWIAFLEPSSAPIGFCKLIGCRRPDLDSDL